MQMGKTEFEQPLVSEPGIGSTPGLTPLYLDDEGNITQDSLLVNPLFLLKNALLARPYDNLGVPGADLNDLLNTIDASGGNPFFDIVLRNPNLGNTTLLQQAVMLQPTMILLWAGSNDVLGAALDGGDLDQITSQADFQSRMTAILTQLRTDLGSRLIVMANIPYVTDIPYVNTLDGVFVTIPGFGNVPVVFDPNLQPIDFGGGLGVYVPLITSETGISHITIPGLLGYQQGLGVPDSAYMVDNYAIPEVNAGQIQAGMIAAGLTPTNLPIDGTMTITAAEETAITNAVEGFNSTITALAGTFSVPVVDANSKLTELNTSGLDGASGKFVLVDPATTAFSLDGVHPNDAGNALIANAFIEILNGVLQLETPIPEINVATKLGQYLPAPAKLRVTRAVKSVGEIFRKK
jgi:lysophospholipase L1-like esterase